MSDTFTEKLQKYADLVVEIGLNVQAGQRVVIRTPVEAAPLVRLITAAAYQRGARYVDVMWHDDGLTLARFEHAPRDSFTEIPQWRVDGMLAAAKRGDAFLSIKADDPDLLNGQDPALIKTAMQSMQKASKPVSEYIMRDAVNWTVISVPIESWAKKIFPTQPGQQAVADLWEAIFEVCRLNQPDPVAAWTAHVDQLLKRSAYLNQKQYDALHYTGPGTDLTLGLPKNHIWKGAQSLSQAGITFSANLPTEEIFTMPHNNRADGVVAATKPLNYGGTLIKDFSLTFAGGKVVAATAAQGEAVLQDLLTTDDGASRLGEVALVPHSSPISQSGLLFYNTLFDENAADHLALGRAYRFTMQGGTTMSNAEFAAAGGNDSLVHVDFMIGSDQIDIDGLTADGQSEPLMRAGEWAFEV